MKRKIILLGFLSALFSITTQINAAEEISVSYNSDNHIVAFPFEKSFRFVATIKNNTNQKKTVNVSLPREDNRSSPTTEQFTILEADSFYELDPGEEIEHSITFEALMSERETPISLNTELIISWETGQQTVPISVQTTYLETQDSSENRCQTKIALVDADSQKTISEATITAFLPSGLESYAASYNGKEYDLDTPCGDFLQKITQDYAVDHKYPGLFLNVAAQGYQYYSEANFLPEDNNQTISLKKITQVGTYQKIGEIDTGFSVWWIKATSDNKLFVISQGTHGGPEITIPETTQITVVNSEAEKLWDQEIAGECWGVDISENGQYVAAGCHDGKIHLWNIDGQELWSYENDNESIVRWVKFSPNSQYLLTGPVEGRAEKAGVFEVQGGKLLWSYYADGYLREGRFASDSQNVYLVSGGGSIFNLKSESGQLNWMTNGDFYIPFIFGYSDEILVTAGKGRVFSGIDLINGERLWQTTVDQTLTAGEVASDGSVVSNSVGGFTYALNSDGEITWVRNYGGVGHNGVWYTENGQYALFGGPNPTLFDKNGSVLWQREKDKNVMMSSVQEINTGGANDTWMSEDATLLLLGGDDGIVQFWQGSVSTKENDYSQLAGLIDERQDNFPLKSDKNPEKNKFEVVDKPSDQKNLSLVIIAFGIAALIGISIAVFIGLKKKKSKQIKTQEPIKKEEKVN